MERIRGFLFGGGRNAITDDKKGAAEDTNNRDEERGISEKMQESAKKPSKSSAEEVADDVDSHFSSSSDDDDGRESSQASGGKKKKKSSIGKKVEDRPPVAVVVAKSKKAADRRSSDGKTYMCRLCNVPVKGHKCPHKSRPGRKGKTTAEDESTTPKNKRSRTAKSPSDASSSYDSPSSAHSDLLLLQGAAMSVLEGGARQSESHSNTELKLVKDQSDDSSWVDDGKEGKERDDHSDMMEQASFISVTKKAASSAPTKVGRRRSTYSCALCGLPLKGHVCPYRKNSTINKRKYATSTDDTDHGERLSVLTAAAGYSEETGEEAWTEIMAPAHILQDEIHSYIVRQTTEQHSRGGGGGGSNHRRRTGMTDNEKTFLQSWSDEAYSQLLDQNELIAENLDLSDARKKIAKRVSKERGKSMCFYR